MPSTTWTGPFAWREGAVHGERRGVGPPIVLCHGTPWSSRLWDGLAGALVAHDDGSAVALRARLLHARASRSLILVDVVALSPWGSAFFRLVGDHAEVFEQLPPELHRGLQPDAPEALHTIVRGLLTSLPGVP